MCLENKETEQCGGEWKSHLECADTFMNADRLEREN